MRHLPIILTLVIGCGSPDHSNPLDPTNQPVIEMEDPVLEDGGVVIRWRYFLSGSSTAEFRVRRTADDVTVTIGRVSVAPGSVSTWKSGSLTDSTVVAGTRVSYSVEAVDKDRTVTAAASRQFELAGVALTVLRHHEDLVLDLTWSRPPPGTIGFRVLRSIDGGDEETLIETSETSMSSYRDSISIGNVPHTYVLESLLSSDVVVRSSRETAMLFEFEPSTWQAGDGGRGFDRYELINGWGFGLGTSSASMSLWPCIQDELNCTAREYDVPIDDYLPLSLNFAPAYPGSGAFAHVAVGSSLDGSRAFLVAQPEGGAILDANGGLIDFVTYPAVDRVDWPSEAPGRLLVTWAGDFGQSNTSAILVREGGEILIFDEQLERRGQFAMPGGDPVDMDYADGAIWLAYQDHLIRSRVDPLSDPVPGPWERVDLPAGTSVTAITRFRNNKLVVLDGTNSKLLVFDESDRLRLTLDAPGQRLDSGDVIWAWSSTGHWLRVRDGEGDVFRSVDTRR